MSKARVKVVLKKLPFNASDDERWSAFKKLNRDFKRARADYGVDAEYREHQYYVRKCDKKRRKEIQKKLAIRLASEEQKGNNEIGVDLWAKQ